MLSIMPATPAVDATAQMCLQPRSSAARQAARTKAALLQVLQVLFTTSEVLMAFAVVPEDVVLFSCR
jgi:hypothetical protein